MPLPLLLLGAGGHARSCIDVIEAEGKFNIVGLLDQQLPTGTHVLGYPVLGTDDALDTYSGHVQHALVTVGHMGNATLRRKLFHYIAAHRFICPIIISPRAYVSTYSSIGAGSIIMHDALINAGAVIGENTIINSKALVEHDAVVEDHCHVSTGAIINGSARIGQDSFVGSQSIVCELAHVPAGGFVKAGSLWKHVKEPSL